MYLNAANSGAQRRLQRAPLSLLPDRMSRGPVALAGIPFDAAGHIANAPGAPSIPADAYSMPLDQQIRYLWAGEWDAAGVDRAAELSDLLKRAGIYRVTDITATYLPQTTIIQDWVGGDAGYFVETPVTVPAYAWVMDGRTVGYLGDYNNDGTYGNKASPLTQYTNQVGAGDNGEPMVAWSSRGHGNVAYVMWVNPATGRVEIHPQWGSSSDANDAQHVAIGIALVLSAGAASGAFAGGTAAGETAGAAAAGDVAAGEVATGAAATEAAGASSADLAAMYGAEGYGAGMTGAETAAYDAALQSTAAAGAADVAAGAGDSAVPAEQSLSAGESIAPADTASTPLDSTFTGETPTATVEPGTSAIPPETSAGDVAGTVTQTTESTVATSGASAGTGSLANLTSTALRVLSTVAAYQAAGHGTIQTPGVSRTPTGAVVAPSQSGVLVTTAPDGTVTTQPMPVGTPYLFADGTLVVNNGDGTYTTVKPDGTTTRTAYPPAMLSTLANVLNTPAKQLAAGAAVVGLLFALFN